MDIFLFVLACLPTLLLMAVVIHGLVTRNEPKQPPPPPPPEKGFLRTVSDLVTGEMDKQIEAERKAEEASALAPLYVGTFFLGSIAFAIYQGVKIWGH